MTAALDMGVAPTGSVRRKGDFLCLVNARSAASLGVRDGSLVAIERKASCGALTAIARLRVVPDVDDNVARVDQTLRKAVGIGDDGTGSTVRIQRVWQPWYRRAVDAAARLLGAQYLHLRVRLSEILDAEKRVCRVPPDAFALMGCGHGDVIVCEGLHHNELADRYEVRRVRLRALEGTNPPEADAVVSDAPILGQKGDLRWIRLDGQARDELTVVAFASIRIRRDVRRRVLDGVRDAGIAFFLSLFALLALVDASGVAMVLLVVGLAVLAVLYVLWKIRTELP